MTPAFDAVLIVSFGGPEGPSDVMPFLEHVLAGKNVPRERLLEVAQHYQHFGGISPLNAHNKALAKSLTELLAQDGPQLPVYLGNRNWHPFLPDTLRQMAGDGVSNALAFITSAYSSYSSCRQYQENIADAQRAVGPAAPSVEKLRAFFNHPTFVDLMAECVGAALKELPADQRANTPVFYTAHSIPAAMAANCDYVEQLTEVARLVSDRTGCKNWQLVFQSRSGPSTQPWLEPDVCDAIREIDRGANEAVIVAPIGFLTDHIEVLWDLDTEAKAVCDELGIRMIRAKTVGNHARFVELIRELILERTSGAPCLAVGNLGARPDVCAPDCCASGRSVRGG